MQCVVIFKSMLSGDCSTGHRHVFIQNLSKLNFASASKNAWGQTKSEKAEKLFVVFFLILPESVKHLRKGKWYQVYPSQVEKHPVCTLPLPQHTLPCGSSTEPVFSNSKLSPFEGKTDVRVKYFFDTVQFIYGDHIVKCCLPGHGRNWGERHHFFPSLFWTLALKSLRVLQQVSAQYFCCLLWLFYCFPSVKDSLAACNFIHPEEQPCVTPPASMQDAQLTEEHSEKHIILSFLLPSHIWPQQYFLAGMAAKAWKMVKTRGWHHLYCLMLSPCFLLFSIWPASVCRLLPEITRCLGHRCLCSACRWFLMQRGPDPRRGLQVLWAYMEITAGIFKIHFGPGEPSQQLLLTFWECKVTLSFEHLLLRTAAVTADKASVHKRVRLPLQRGHVP